MESLLLGLSLVRNMKLSSKDLVSQKGLGMLGKLCHSAGEGIMFFNKAGNIEMVNPKGEEMFGYKESELVGQPIEVLVPKASRGNHKGYRDGYIEKPKPRPMGQGIDLKGVRKDGSEFPIEISLNTMTHDNEMIIVAFITDISTRKENERKLEEYATSLEQKVKDRTSELEHMNLGLQSQIQERKMAEQALKKSLGDLRKAEKEILKSLEREKELGELKSRFVSMASHEFRTPLTTVLSSANLIGKYTEKDQQDSRLKHVDRIKNSVQNLTSILNDFLSIEKLESGVLDVHKDSFDLVHLVKEMEGEASGILKKAQTIVFEVPSELRINSDPHIIKNVLLNLISNAAKYSSEGETVEVSVIVANQSVSIEVADNGIGVPEEEQKNLFERFFRAKNATNIQGTGLGLHIVKKYVEMLNGSISFQSKSGIGSTFCVNLPID